MKRIAKLLAGAAALAAVALAGSAFAASHGKTKIGFIYVGPVGDHGWSYQPDLPSKRLLVTRLRPTTLKTYRKVPMRSAPSSVLHVKVMT